MENRELLEDIAVIVVMAKEFPVYFLFISLCFFSGNKWTYSLSAVSNYYQDIYMIKCYFFLLSSYFGI